jgi:hypothetical protein
VILPTGAWPASKYIEDGQGGPLLLEKSGSCVERWKVE